MKANIYSYRDYKRYVLDLIEANPLGSRGRRKELAEAIGCQVSHVTNVLSGPAHFSQEQTEALARDFGLNSRETEFLLLLVQYQRAGTESLKLFFERLIKEKEEKYSTLKSRLAMPDTLARTDEALYYSSWQFGAVHVLLSIPVFQTREAISKKLNLPLSRVDFILGFLVDAGLCKKEGLNFLIHRPLLHLDKSSHLMSKHHINWRLKAIAELEKTDSSRLNYSSVFTLSKKDYPKVREILASALESALGVITPSKEEELAAMNLDLYRL